MKLPFISKFIESQAKASANRILEKAIDSQFRSLDASNAANEKTYEPATKIDFALSYERSVWALACISTIAESVASVPLKLYRKGSDVEITEGDVWEVINAPNRNMTQHDLLESIVSYLELTGDSFLEISEERNGFKSLRAYWVECKYNKFDKTFSYIYKPNGVTEATFNEKDIIHFKYFNPNSDFYGYTPMTAITDSLILNFNADRYSKQFFKNGGMVNMYLKVKASLQDFEFKRLKQEANTNFAGIKNAHTIPVLDNDAEFKNAGLDINSILLKPTKDQCRDEILTAFGVPPIMMAVLSGMETYNNSEIQENTYWKNTIKPKLIKIQNVFNQQYFWKLGYEVLFDIDSIPALKDKVDEQLKYMTLNEVRALKNLNPIEGGDQAPVKTSTSFQMSYAQPVTPVKKTSMRNLNIAIVKAAIDNHNKEYEKNLVRSERALIEQFHNMSTEISALVPKIEKDIIQKDLLTTAIGKLDANTKQMMKTLADENTQTNESAIISNYSRQTGKYPSQEIIAKIKKQSAEHIDEWSKQSADSITETLKSRLETAINNNKTQEGLQKSIREIFEGTARDSYSHARMIARTETGRIVNSTRVEVAKENGFEKKTWIATSDSHSRDWHNGEMDGVTVGIEESFHLSDGSQMMYPGDPAGGPNNNCNCRCTFLER